MMTGGVGDSLTGPDLSAPELFAAAARARPRATAVIESRGRWDYATTDAHATRLAWRLRARLGLSGEDRVAVAATRSRAMVAGVLGVLKAGCAYVPVYPADPADRLRAMLAEADVRAIVGPASLRRLSLRLPHIDLGALSARSGQPDPAGSASLPVTIRPAGLAYVIFTSGSTGRPKGVAVEHRALSSLLAWSRDFFQVRPTDVFLQFARLTFDVSVWEILTPLSQGAATVLASGADVLSPEAIERLIREHGVSHLDLPAAVLDAMDMSRMPSLRFCMTGTDPVRARTVRHVAAPGRTVVNGYGPTEATDVTVAGICDPCSDAPPPIGLPVAGTTAYVLDGELHPAPGGAPGELYLGGRQLARCYIGRAAQTAERFVPDPWGPPGSRLYRTGDLVRRLPDGAIEFIGRRDRQLKVRGIRVELAEVEQAIETAGGVTAAAVIAVRHHDGHRMIAHVVSGAEPRALRRDLVRTLPGHLVPSAVVVHETLPYTVNGKIDYARLERLTPQPATGRGRGCVSLLECFVDEIVGTRPAPGDTFLDLGGDSLDAIRVVARLREHAMELDVREMLGPVPVTSLRPRAIVGRVQAAISAGAEDSAPLTPAQAAIWYHQLLMPASEAYHIPVCLELNGPIDSERLHAAWHLVVQRHDALRSRIAVRGVRPFMVADTAPPPIAVHDLTKIPGQAQRDAMRRIFSQTQTFALTNAAPFRLTLLHLNPGRHRLDLTCHHILCDGWSLTVLIEDLAAAYRSLGSNRRQFAASPAASFLRFARWQSTQVTEGRYAGGVRYWQEVLRNRNFAAAWRAGASPSQIAVGHIFDIGSGTTARLRRRFNELGTTTFIGLLSGFARALAAWFGESDLVIGVVAANRPDLASERVIGQFVNTLPLPLSAGRALAMPELVGRTREIVQESLPHWDVPLPLISAALKQRQARRTGGPWHAVFDFDSTPVSTFDAGPLTGTLSDDGLQQGAVSELSLRVFERHNSLRAVMVGDAGVIDRADLVQVARMTAAAWQKLAS